MSRRVLLPLAAPALAAALVAGPPAPAAAQESGEDEQVSVLDGAYTEDQAERGERVYEQECSACHAPGYFQASTFVQAWAGRPVRSLFRRISTTMPEDNPGSLDGREYAAVIAYMLSLNGFPTGPDELPGDAEALRRILMEAKSGEGGR